MTAPSKRNIQRLFLIIEGNNNSYPNFSNAKVQFIIEDPSTVKLQEQFVSSPIFPLTEDGYENSPLIDEGTLLTFVMVPSIIPAFYEIVNNFESNAALWWRL